MGGDASLRRPICNRCRLIPIANRAPSAPEYFSCGDLHEVFMNRQCRTLRLCRTEYPHDRHLFPADQPTAWQKLRAAKLALTATFLRYFSDAFLDTLQAALRIAKFMSGFETPMAPLRCNRQEIALRIGLPGNTLKAMRVMPPRRNFRQAHALNIR